MSSTPRLTELRRQRALLQTHLAWLDGEIAAAEAADKATGASAASPIATVRDVPAGVAASAAVTAGGTRPEAASADKDPDQVMDQFRVPSADLQRDVRKGCFLYFAAALLIVAGVVAVLYFALRR